MGCGKSVVGVLVAQRAGAPFHDLGQVSVRPVRQLPVERDNRVVYRIKSVAETFERTADEYQLSRTD